ncbi:MAG TPA: GDCCVxC domain-containing (seleno)protein [Thermoleophilaceae bacterium]|nr:GDCCVxC domain-containing (seleno)protein [Thermoleophilaceae bacterium]
MQLEATITPGCGATAREKMPETACQRFYQCSRCGLVLRPREGDCCVFCSYADIYCPPRQTA